MPTQIQRILNILGKAPNLCDDCIARACYIPQRQTVNRICRDNPEKIGRIDAGPKPCAGCRKDYKILRFLQPETPQAQAPRSPGAIQAHRKPPRAAVASPRHPTLPEALGRPSRKRPVRAIDPTYSREEDLRKNFNETVASALGVAPEDYFGRLTIERLLALKVITSTIHATITLKLTIALVEWLSGHLTLRPEQKSALRATADTTKPFESGFDLNSIDPNVIAEVKGNIPVKGGSVFGAAQLRGLTNDVLQMFGRPANGKTLETLSENSKIRREGLNDATKFLAVYDSKKVRDASEKWMTSFRKVHDGLNIEFAEGVTTFRTDTVYVVFLKLDNLPPTPSVKVVTD